jgi:hypothetical protein
MLRGWWGGSVGCGQRQSEGYEVLTVATCRFAPWEPISMIFRSLILKDDLDTDRGRWSYDSCRKSDSSIDFIETEGGRITPRTLSPRSLQSMRFIGLHDASPLQTMLSKRVFADKNKRCATIIIIVIIIIIMSNFKDCDYLHRGVLVGEGRCGQSDGEGMRDPSDQQGGSIMLEGCGPDDGSAQ